MMRQNRILQLILLRHGLTAFNQAGKMQGHIDTDLTSEGQRQAKYVAQHLVSVNPLKIYSSDLKRAVDTALPLAEATECTVVTDCRLRETHLGNWSGLTHHEVDEQWPGDRLTWKDNPDFSPPEGETKILVAQRGMDFVREVILNNPDWPESDRPIIIVSHNGFIAALTAALVELPQNQWNILDGLTNCGWVILRKIDDGPWRISAWNRTVSDIPAESYTLGDASVL